MTTPTTSSGLGGTFRLGDREVPRIGYGAMQLAGPGVFGPPRDRDAAIAVLREAYELGIRHIDTSDFYGPHVTNQIIREALAPYADDLVIVTKLGGRRDDNGGWLPAQSPEQLRSAVHDNLRNLGLDVLEIANVRYMDQSHATAGESVVPFEDMYGAVADLQREGLIRHLGVSTVDVDQAKAAQAIAPFVCVQNHYNIAQRGDDELVAWTAAQDIAFVPYFPLGGFSPLQSDTLASVAERLGTTPFAVAQAWLLQRSPNILLIPGTSSVDHLRENVAVAGLELSADDVAELDAIGG